MLAAKRRHHSPFSAEMVTPKSPPRRRHTLWMWLARLPRAGTATHLPGAGADVVSEMHLVKAGLLHLLDLGRAHVRQHPLSVSLQQPPQGFLLSVGHFRRGQPDRVADV